MGDPSGCLTVAVTANPSAGSMSTFFGSNGNEASSFGHGRGMSEKSGTLK
eukprot:CAMPEP_0197941850 /NCGR_PEP_ID=MMETSP1439-20131203/123444_1 /TAXON_ID=66791 /ORGANISM="Gonyaulax spinifera, Strain CCMP409" /LENGTH=49 /DNA_ID=CAMNT_0043565071 /DNA_START=57 /DNA_END=206 /DNA_ORIENTATION=-